MIVTDFRYVEQAGRQAPECDCIRTGNGLSEAKAIASLCEKYAVKAMRVETDFLTHDAFVTLTQTLPGVTLSPLAQLPQELRLVKDESEIECIKKAAASPARHSKTCWARFTRA